MYIDLYKISFLILPYQGNQLKLSFESITCYVIAPESHIHNLQTTKRIDDIYNVPGRCTAASIFFETERSRIFRVIE